MTLARFLILYFAVILVSCKKELIDKINFKKAALQYDLVIEGGVNSFSKEQFIRLSKPSYNVSDNVAGISNAEVYINSVKLDETSTPGIYSVILPENKNYGFPYRLKVIYNNNTYFAEDTLKKVTPIVFSNLNIITQIQNDNLVLSVPKHIFSSVEPGKQFYQFKGESDWDPSKLAVSQTYAYTHIFAPPNGLYPLLEQRTNVTLLPADSVKVYKFSVSNAYQRYLFNLFQETDWKNIFSGNPGLIKGNISGNALGYFYCTDVVSKKILARDLEK